MRLASVLAGLVICLASPSSPKGYADGQKTPIRITADLSDAPRKIYRAEIGIPVEPGLGEMTGAKRGLRRLGSES